jgi:hypothetical protein
MYKRSKLERVIPRSLLPRAKATRRLVEAFAERSNMVYFGFVSQRSDEHHILRGLTVSTKHIDDHYCIGTVNGYDVVFVERTDSIQKDRHHQWHIMEFDLKTTADLPHIFIGSPKHGHGFHELIKIKFPHLAPAAVGSLGQYPSEFTSHFNLYVTPADTIKAEQIIPPQVALKIGQHFKGLVVEITEDALYVYSEKSHLSGELLDVMLANGTWLAQVIDENSQSLTD